MGNVETIERTWRALSDGDLQALRAVLAPDARWRAVEDGPWNCESAQQILSVIGRQLKDGLSGELVQIEDLGDRAIVAFRPSDGHEETWPLQSGIRHLVLSMRDGLIVEMKGCRTRLEAECYAAAG